MGDFFSRSNDCVSLCQWYYYKLLNKSILWQVHCGATETVRKKHYLRWIYLPSVFCRALHPSPLPEQPKKSGKKNKITDKNVSSAENTAQFMLTLCWQRWRWLAEAIHFYLAMNFTIWRILYAGHIHICYFCIKKPYSFSPWNSMSRLLATKTVILKNAISLLVTLNATILSNMTNNIWWLLSEL